jgi:hypothetical protein
MDFYDLLYKEYLKDLENGKTNLDWDEYLYYCLNNQDGVCCI